MNTPYFVRIGRISANKSGVGSRGYHVFRKGTTVRVVFGPVRTERSNSVRIIWERTSYYVDYTFDTIPEAIAKMESVGKERIRGKYQLLEGRAKIERPAGLGMTRLDRTRK
jgi:hypothetical protein